MISGERILDWALCATIGVAVGAVFFLGLRWTVDVLPRVRHPAVLAVVSLAARLALLLGALWLVGAGDWSGMLAFALGVVLARILIVRRIREVRPC